MRLLNVKPCLDCAHGPPLVAGSAAVVVADLDLVDLPDPLFVREAAVRVTTSPTGSGDNADTAGLDMVCSNGRDTNPAHYTCKPRPGPLAIPLPPLRYRPLTALALTTTPRHAVRKTSSRRWATLHVAIHNNTLAHCQNAISGMLARWAGCSSFAVG